MSRFGDCEGAEKPVVIACASWVANRQVQGLRPEDAFFIAMARQELPAALDALDLLEAAMQAPAVQDPALAEAFAYIRLHFGNFEIYNGDGCKLTVGDLVNEITRLRAIEAAVDAANAKQRALVESFAAPILRNAEVESK